MAFTNHHIDQKGSAIEIGIHENNFEILNQ
jgi:hypothetical protein